mmetsp:Transcript_85135/g.260144  ORF Transcript_85135/g.260144 Transcript_85135/m.260144 type:complete len:208 (-) Transcript_85135:821-1444(-)
MEAVLGPRECLLELACRRDDRAIHEIEWEVTINKLVQHHAQCPYVGLRQARPLVNKYTLRGYVLGSCCGSAAARLWRSETFCSVEVDQFDLRKMGVPFHGHEVSGCDVAMDDAQRMQPVDARQNLVNNDRNFCQFAGLFCLLHGLARLHKLLQILSSVAHQHKQVLVLEPRVHHLDHLRRSVGRCQLREGIRDARVLHSLSEVAVGK